MVKCPKCNQELLLDHVVEHGGRKDYWYTCINKRCKNYLKGFSPSGGEKESMIKAAD